MYWVTDILNNAEQLMVFAIMSIMVFYGCFLNDSKACRKPEIQSLTITIK